MSTREFISSLMGASGWLAAGLTYWKSRSDAKQKEREILQKTRQELDSNSSLQNIVQTLEAERLYNSKVQEPVPLELRRLPAFLEDVASHWEFKTVSIKAAYDAIGKIVLWCDESKIMWEGENPPRQETHWRLFNKFAAAMRLEKLRRGET